MGNVVMEPDGVSAVTLVPLPGSLRSGGGHDDRGGGSVPRARAGMSREGRVECLVATAGDQALSSLLGLRSGVGPGAVSVSGDDVETAAGALVDVTIRGEAVQTAVVSWKGTVPEEQ